MSKLQFSTRLSSLRSTAGTWGEAQSIVIAGQHVLLQLQTRNCNTSSILHRQYTIANLPLETTRRFRNLLSAATEIALDCSAFAPPRLRFDATVNAITSWADGTRSV
jgi:hypothetical protein